MLGGLYRALYLGGRRRLAAYLILYNFSFFSSRDAVTIAKIINPTVL